MWQGGKQVHTSGPDQGCQSIPAPAPSDGPRPAGIGLRHPDRRKGQMHAARAKSGQSAARSLDGRVREWVEVPGDSTVRHGSL